jgi:hypothetical protein
LCHRFLKVLGVSDNNPTVWQKYLLPSEVTEAMANAARATSAAAVLANEAVRDMYSKLKGQGEGKEKEEEQQQQQQVEMRDVDDECPVSTSGESSHALLQGHDLTLVSGYY